MLQEKYEFFLVEAHLIRFPEEIRKIFTWYSKCPKISNTKVSDKMVFAISADPDQTAPSEAV